MSSYEYQKEYRVRNRVVLAEKARARYLEKHSENKLHHREYYAANREKLVAQRRIYVAAKRDSVRLTNALSYLRHKPKRRAANARWEKANPAKVKAYSRKKYLRNRASILERNRLHDQANKEQINARRRKRYYADPCYRIRKNLQRRLSTKLAGKHLQFSERTKHLIGCNVAFLRDYLAARFTDGMTWQNYGAWQVDHRIPCAWFDLSQPEEQRRCFHYSNLQPMWRPENSSKSDSIPPPHQAMLV